MIRSLSNNNWEALFQHELNQAEIARARGNEGKARVCARRAAGIVIKEYLRGEGVSLSESSAYNVLKFFHSFLPAPEDARNITGHFLERVDTTFSLPVDVDLIQDSRWLAQRLLLANE